MHKKMKVVLLMSLCSLVLISCGKEPETTTELASTEVVSKGVPVFNVETEETENTEVVETETEETEVEETQTEEVEPDKTGDSTAGNKKKNNSSKSNSNNNNNNNNTTNWDDITNNGASWTGDTFERAMAESIWAQMNAERTAAGLDALTWDETAYQFACNRSKQIVSNFSHDGCEPYGENILYTSNSFATATDLHMMWYNSPGHHENYMRESYGSGACAVYRSSSGWLYGVENFSNKPRDGGTSYTTSDGKYTGLPLDLYEAYESGHKWTASNGVELIITAGGSVYCSGANEDAFGAAWDEWWDNGCPGSY